MSGDGVNSAGAAAGPDQSRAAVSDPAPAAVPAWVGTAVWRGTWQLIAAVLITAAALWFAGRASDLLRYLILAQLLAFALEPAVAWLHQRRGWRRGSATGLLLDHLDAWSEAIIAAGSYPKRIAGVYNVGGGPHFGSGLTVDTAAELYERNAL